MGKQHLPLLALPVLALVIWYWWSNQGRAHNINIDQLADTGAYDPFSHWAIRRPGGYVRHFPDRIGPVCLGEVFQNEAGALSTSVAAGANAEEYADA